MSAAMGMMHEGYFVGRKELIAWIQANFQPSFGKIEDLANGVVYCQIVDSIYPGTVPMSKVKMQARTEVDSIHNFKILQTSFSKKKIDRFIDVDKLSKRSFQTNMEFVQFMKCYWDMHAPNANGPNDGAFANENAQAQSPANEAPAKARAKHEPAASEQEQPKAGAQRKSTNSSAKPSASGAQRESGAAAGGSAAAQRQLTLEVTELKMSVENLERERDFYYSKLREVEVLCQNHEEQQVPFLQQVLDILYKTDEADEFIAPDEVKTLAYQMHNPTLWPFNPLASQSSGLSILWPFNPLASL